jgi:CHAT domain-containing protein
MIAASLRTAAVLVDVDATEREVRDLIQGRNVVHLATHGWLDELAPYASSLVLAGRDELTVAELVGLRVGAELAVLSACDTGRGAATLGGDVVGLTRALLAAGVRRMLVSLWPVDDLTACVTMVKFYEHLTAETPPARALALAQVFVHSLDNAALRLQYAGLCQRAGTDPGDSDAQDRRRGQLELPAELRDDEELPPPLGGSAERHWAPFVLVGA